MRIRLELAALAALAAGWLFGCSSMPVPKREGDSLLIVVAINPTGSSQIGEWEDVVVLNGPTPLELRSRGGAYTLLIRRVAPGTYTFGQRFFQIKDLQTPSEAPAAGSLEIAAGTINLCPTKLARWADDAGQPRAKVATVTADDQRMVTAEISDYLRFGEWVGRRFVGFGPFRPRFSLEKDAYPFRVTTSPAGARLAVDAQDWGTTPAEADLTPGRHQITLEKEGFAVTKIYVTVESEGEIEVPLAPLAQRDAPLAQRDAPAHGASRVVMEPFRNLGSPDGASLAAVFDDSLEIALAAGDDGLDLLRGQAAASAAGPADFAAAERQGGDLLVTGSYVLDAGHLLVQAALFDVASRMTRAAVTYAGPSGLAMFAGIDGLAQEISAGAAKQGTPPGEMVIRRSDPLSSVAYDRKRTEKEVIEKRLQRKTSVDVHGFLGGEFDTIDDPPVLNNSMRMQTGGPALGLGVTYERQLSGPFSLALVTNPFVGRASSEQSRSLIWEVPLYVGPRYSFLGYRTDLYWGLLGEARFAGAFTAKDPGSGLSSTYGPFLIGGLSFDTGLKLYTYERMSRPARFVNLGMMISLFGVRATTDFGETKTVPIALWLYGGLGGRL